MENISAALSNSCSKLWIFSSIASRLNIFESISVSFPASSLIVRLMIWMISWLSLYFSSTLQFVISFSILFVVCLRFSFLFFFCQQHPQPCLDWLNIKSVFLQLSKSFQIVYNDPARIRESQI